MDYKKLEKQQALLVKIKEFDQLILSIEKMANKIDGDKAKISISLSVEEPLKEKLEMDEDGSICTGSSLGEIVFSWSPFGGTSAKPQKSTTKEKIKLSISDIYAYELLGSVMKQAQKEREKIIKRLEKLCKVN
jgi:hypothetical protein